jgi:ADP-heptose:LPS heptosyltransferase
MSSLLPIHFFTIVLNGEPFIRHHIEVFRRLNVPWTWHVVEGLAAHRQNPACGEQREGRLPAEFLSTGHSNDGTSDYLDSLARAWPDQVRLYRKPPGRSWGGKVEMVNAPIPNLTREGLLWQIDADELWTVNQIEQTHAAFVRDPKKSAAWFNCHFFVGPEICTSTPNVFGNFNHMESVRVWRFQPGDYWQTHEPPTLVRPASPGGAVDLGRLNPLMHEETSRLGLRFQHFAYAIEAQIRFEEDYYGYGGALASWNRLQTEAAKAPRLRSFFSWVWEAEIGTAHTLRTFSRRLFEPWIPASRAMPARRQGTVPLAQRDATGRWRFFPELPPAQAAPHMVLLRTDRIGDNLLSFGLIQPLREAFPAARITLACPQDTACLIPDRSQVDEVVEFERDRGHADPAYRRQIATRLQRVPVDWLLCPQFNRDNLANKLSVLVQAPRRVGFAGESIHDRPRDRRKYRRYARHFHELIPVTDREEPELEKYGQFLKGLGVPAPARLPHFLPAEADEAAAETLLRGAGLLTRPLLAVFPAAANPIRTLPQVGAAIRGLSELAGFAVLGLGDAQHRDLLECTLRESGMDGLNLAGQTTLTVAAALLRRCRLGVGAETGLGHLACAVGCRNVIVLGGGDFGRFYPYSPLTTAVSLPLSCYYCHYDCRQPSVYCLKSVPVPTLRAAIVHALQQENSKPLLCVPPMGVLIEGTQSLRVKPQDLARCGGPLPWPVREI